MRAELSRVLAAFAEDGGKEHARGACYACESLGRPMEREIDWLLKRPALVQQGGHAALPERVRRHVLQLCFKCALPWKWGHRCGPPKPLPPLSSAPPPYAAAASEKAAQEAWADGLEAASQSAAAILERARNKPTGLPRVRRGPKFKGGRKARSDASRLQQAEAAKARRAAEKAAAAKARRRRRLSMRKLRKTRKGIVKK